MLHCFRPDRTLGPLFAAVLMAAVVALSLVWTQASSCATRGGALGGSLIYMMAAGILVGAGLTSPARPRVR